MGGFGSLVGAGGTTDSGTGRAAARSSVRAQAWGGTQGHGPTAGLRGHCVRAAHGMSVKVAAEGAVWGCKLGAPLFSDVAPDGVLPRPLAGRSCGVRRDGRDRLEVAKRGWDDAESAPRPRVCRPQPDGPGKRREASGISWSTRVGSRCRSASPAPTGMMSRSLRRFWTPWSVARDVVGAWSCSATVATPGSRRWMPSRSAGTSPAFASSEWRDGVGHRNTGAGSSKPYTVGSTAFAGCSYASRNSATASSRLSISPLPLPAFVRRYLLMDRSLHVVSADVRSGLRPGVPPPNSISVRSVTRTVLADRRASHRY